MRKTTIIFAAMLGLSTVLSAAGENRLEFTSITGTVQILKNGQVIMELTENDPLPTNLDADISFKVLTGTVELKANNQVVITGAAGANFSVTQTENSATINSATGTPVEAKDNIGNTYVLTDNSAVTFASTEQGFTVSVAEGRILQSNPSGETTIIGSGESVVVAGAPATEPPPAPVVEEEKKEEQEQSTADSNDTEDTSPLLGDIIQTRPQTNVIPSKEEHESEEIVSRSAP
ncbi:MAG: hypothetical protein PHW69_05860 [Elusimicrobiaceae bacterium]|nr:hypothetical protein [Elusimicrobiaceae bacterium]